MNSKVPSVTDYDVPTWLAHWRDAILWDPIAAFTVVLAISTVGLWIATRRLWRGAERQARDLTRSADAAEISATAAKAASELVAHQLRAYIHIDSGEILQFEVGKVPRAILRPKNTGQTPALDVMSLTTICLATPGEKVETTRPDLGAGPGLTIGAGGTFELNSIGIGPVTADDVQAATNGQLVAYVIGIITYNDIFGRPERLEVVLETRALGRDPRLQRADAGAVVFVE